MELTGRFHRILAGHGVGHEQNLHRVQQVFQLLQFVHQLIVDVQAARGIHQQNVATGIHRLAPCGTRQIHRRFLFRRARVNGSFQIARQDRQLLARRRAVNVH